MIATQLAAIPADVNTTTEAAIDSIVAIFIAFLSIFVMLRTNLCSAHIIKLKVAWHYSRYLVAYTIKAS
jgi:hypothetical protein